LAQANAAEADVGPLRASRVAKLAISALVAAQVIRVLADEPVRSRPLPYAVGTAALVLIFALLLMRPHLPAWVSHVALAIESAIVIGLLSLEPEMDTISTFFVPLSFLTPLLLPARQARGWILAFLFLTAAPLMLTHGWLEGMALASGPMAGVIALPELMVVNHQAERARAASQSLLTDLGDRNRQLQSYAARVEELAALQERERLARDLHDRVSQILFGMQLTSRSAALLARDDPRRVLELLDRLDEGAADALSQLRHMISEMRP
jgi:signal transduction histidine kinase